MKYRIPIEHIINEAQAVLREAEALEELNDLDLPGVFVFAAPAGSRLVVGTLEEFHTARTVLRREFGWKDKLNNKFFSGGVAIVTFAPAEDVVLPLHFELWVESPPESFPPELLGNCKIVKCDNPEYAIVCSAPSEV